ncbi:hypothetical protein [Hymenobacter sp. APR13]|uniref:hypothetical protein n=1 Tax=Hymenobacter sp. APR13 TaxID=1356852 RepID=UPI0012E03A24|nr:hypothetical protein [Hymenobacter sp. APR13]
MHNRSFGNLAQGGHLAVVARHIVALLQAPHRQEKSVANELLGDGILTQMPATLALQCFEDTAVWCLPLALPVR